MSQNSEGLTRRIRDSKTQADFPGRLADKVRELQRIRYFGRIIVSLQDGVPQNVKLEESKKPEDI